MYFVRYITVAIVLSACKFLPASPIVASPDDMVPAIKSVIFAFFLICKMYYSGSVETLSSNFH
ncbi:MAG: hypothetical protein A9957_10160 [Methanohalophilus sp. DAL1]|jgi:hypothetical protein|nr:MAG: hypothetical protein A9957_10160 [Methanohalophilus sp. DAL1]